MKPAQQTMTMFHTTVEQRLERPNFSSKELQIP
jgi:hypothetical protein